MENYKPKVLGLIMARGGSKSIPKKSIALCAGRPLLEYTTEAAFKAEGIDRLIISTDDKEVAEVARNKGVEVLFMRPKELALDDTPDFPVIEHALNWFQKNGNWVPDIIVQLRPTTPLKSSEDITKGISLLKDHPEAQSVRSVCKPLHTPFKMYRFDAGDKYMTPILQKEYPEIFTKYKEPYNISRQMLPVVWRHSGYVDIMRSSVILEDKSVSGKKILPLFFEEWRDVDIDSVNDLNFAEMIIENLRKKGKKSWQ